MFKFVYIVEFHILNMYINDFTMHVIILKWLRIQKYKQNRKTSKRGQRERRSSHRMRFYSFTYVIDHWNSCFFFYVHSLHSSCDCFCTTCFIFYAQLVSQLLQAYSHTNISFEYMNFLKIIQESFRNEKWKMFYKEI